MLVVLHYLICAVYLLAPPAAVAIEIVRKRRRAPALGLISAFSGGAVLGTAVILIYSFALKSFPKFTQLLLTMYLAMSLLVILKIVDALLGKAIDAARRWTSRRAVRTGIRGVVMVAIGLPYVMAAVMTYRPKVVPRDDPTAQMGVHFQPASFQSSDGIEISAWWIPAVPRSTRRAESDRTVVICHGLGADKSNQLVLARQLVPNGYNVLIFDFRAHGASGGQMTTFGDLERRDVLAAVAWVRSAHPQQARHLYGLGTSTGGAALIAAAADPAPEGQAIEAVAVYGAFDDLGSLAHDVSNRNFFWPINSLAWRLAFPVACAHVGRKLYDFKPAELVAQIWPRPVLVIHGRDDEIIPFIHGERLYDAAFQPKRSIWLTTGGHNEIIANENVAKEVLLFFDAARAVPVI